MPLLTEAELLTLWETGAAHCSIDRALLLATAAGADAATVAELTVGRREAHVLRLRAACFGSTMACVVNCPVCAAELELTLTLDDLRTREPAAEPGWTPVRAGDLDIEVRPVTSGDLLAVRGAADPRTALLARCGRTRDGSPVPAEAEPKAIAALADCDQQADMVLELDCAVCGREWRSPFDLTGFVWTELTAYAQRLLREIHLLATAYGWSEGDVLAVSPARRRCYLELVSA